MGDERGVVTRDSKASARVTIKYVKTSENISAQEVSESGCRSRNTGVYQAARAVVVVVGTL